MHKLLSFFVPLTLLLMLSACSKPAHHPKHPNYKIIKPSVKYTPSVKNLDKMVKQLQGSPYVWAEEGPNNFDCSGFTYYLYGSMGIEIPRVARHQALRGKKIDVNSLKYGDLIFFATSKRSRRKITHVGMYMGNGWFTHASTAKYEIIYTNLFTSKYYKKRLRVCRRYLPETDIIKSPQDKPWLRNEVKSVPTYTSTPAVPSLEAGKKAIVIQAPTKGLSAGSSSGDYFVQVGSFSGQPDVHTLSKISSYGFNYKIIQFNRGNEKVSKLLVGPYLHRSEVVTVLEKVKQNIQKDAFIAEIR